MIRIRLPHSRAAGARAALLAAGLATGLAALPSAALAGDAPRLIAITGTGEVRAVPDQARLSAGVVSEAKTAAAALADNSRKMNAVFAAIRKLGVPDKSVQTTGFNISPQYPPYNSKQERHITGYEVSNTVTVRLSDLKKVGAALDALVAAGANRVNAVSFSIADPKPLLTKARIEAVREATKEAQTYARAAGVTLGPVQSIREGSSPAPRPEIMLTAMRAKASTPIADGEQSVRATVTISWQIR